MTDLTSLVADIADQLDGSLTAQFPEKLESISTSNLTQVYDKHNYFQSFQSFQANERTQQNLPIVGVGRATPAHAYAREGSFSKNMERLERLETGSNSSIGSASSFFPVEEERVERVETPPCAGSSLVETWRRGLLRLRAASPPCPGFRSGEWQRVFSTAHAFLEHHAEAACALGWSSLDLFGVHRSVGLVRVDTAGALMLANMVPTAVEPNCIRLGNLTYYRRPPHPEAVPVWDFRS